MQPCNNCTKRGSSSCVFVPQSTSGNGTGPSQQDRGRTTGVQNRIQRLERLVATLAEGAGGLAPASNIVGEPGTSSNDELFSTGASPPSQLPADGKGIRFVSSSHWESILSDIAGIKDDFSALQKSAGDTQNVTKGRSFSVPRLLFQAGDGVTLDELICSVPPRPTVQILLGLLLEESNLSMLLTIVHFPTFEEQCKALWTDPASVSLTWLSMLYSCLSLALQRSGTEIEGIPLPEAAANMFTTKAAQCLWVANYSNPTKYTVEAITLYLASEHYWTDENFFQVTLVFSMIARTAYRCGYHRDAKRYTEISVFHGEMRRRTWAMLLHMDLLLAHKTGIPRAIDERTADTERPLNVLEEDLHPDMAQLPAARTDEPTSTGFRNYMVKLLTVQGRITDSLNSATQLSYDDIMALEKDLVQQIATRPAWLDPPDDDRQLAKSASDASRIIEADMSVQTARMLLHRQFLVVGRSQQVYSYSRSVCVASACRALKYQGALHDYPERSVTAVKRSWRLMSLIAHNFLLAGVLLYFDLEQSSRSEQRSDETIAEDQEHLRLINVSHQVWSQSIGKVHGARKATKAIKAMLKRLEGSFPKTQITLQPSSNGQVISHGDPTNSTMVPHAAFIPDPIDHPQPPTSTPSSGNDNFMDFNDFLGDTGFDIDWAEWDAQFSGMSVDFL